MKICLTLSLKWDLKMFSKNASCRFACDLYLGLAREACSKQAEGPLRSPQRVRAWRVHTEDARWSSGKRVTLSELLCLCVLPPENWTWILTAASEAKAATDSGSAGQSKWERVRVAPREFWALCLRVLQRCACTKPASPPAGSRVRGTRKAWPGSDRRRVPRGGRPGTWGPAVCREARPPPGPGGQRCARPCAGVELPAACRRRNSQHGSVAL